MMVAKQLRSAVVIGYMLSITWIRRNLLSLVWLFVTPFSILFIVTVTTSGQAFVQGVIGSLLLVLVSVGTGLAGDATWYRLELKLHDYFIASPVHQFAFLLGIALAGLFYSVPALGGFVSDAPLARASIGEPSIGSLGGWDGLVVLCGDWLLGFYLRVEPSERLAVRIVAECDSWDSAASFLLGRDSSK